MTTQITFSDLIASLRKASSSPEAHAYAQTTYFSELQEDSVLINCGSACCIAGDLIMKAHADEPEGEIDKIIAHCKYSITAGDWVRKELDLSHVEATLAFDSNTHHEIHRLLADLLEQGLRLPDPDECWEISCESTYTEFDCIYFGNHDYAADLDEVLDWMKSLAR